MNKKVLVLECVFLVILALFLGFYGKKDNKKYQSIEAEVIMSDESVLVFKDNEDNYYSIDALDKIMNPGDKIVIDYTGVIDTNNDRQMIEVVGYTLVDDSNLKKVNLEEGIFKMFYNQAKEYYKTLSLEEKIGQVLLARYDDGIDKKVSGYIFYEKDFAGKTEDEIVSLISSLNSKSNVPLLLATDEEGGRVVRVSSNTNLRKFPFKSPSELYTEGGLELIRKDNIEKNNLLKSIGLNVNLAPVLDMASAGSYIYDRTLKEDKDITSNYAKTIIQSSKDSGISNVLKHFPGYGDNLDTHTSSSDVSTSLDIIMDNYLVPFKEGIKEGAEAILVNHNVYNAIGPDMASLSKGVHNLLRDNLNFTGVIITDDLDMKALDGIDNRYLKALKVGNDLLIVTDVNEAYNEIKSAIDDNSLTMDELDEHAINVIAWKYYKYLLPKNSK